MIIELKATLTWIWSTVYVYKIDSPLDIESESGKWMDISSTLNVSVLIQASTFSISSGKFSSGT